MHSREALTKDRVRTPDWERDATTVLGFEYTNLDYNRVCDVVDRWVKEGEPAYVIAAPVSSLIMARRSVEVSRAFKDGNLITADGVPIVWAQRFLGHSDATRVYGPHLMLHVLERAAEQGWNVGLYGGHEERLGPLVDRLQTRYPKLRITYRYSPPFRPLTAPEKEAVVAGLKAAGVHVLFVGLGAPKQELWMHEFSPRIPAVMFGVGAAFDFHAGFVPQAPPVMQKMGLEWLYRLVSEPRRLWKRYLTTIPPFILLISREILLAKLTGKNHQVRDQDRAVSRRPGLH